jgi:hypothetical protein
MRQNQHRYNILDYLIQYIFNHHVNIFTVKKQSIVHSFAPDDILDFDDEV